MAIRSESPPEPDFSDYEQCEHCGGEGFSGHDCGEDTCCCLEPEENIPCQYCDGKGVFQVPDPACPEESESKK